MRDALNQKVNELDFVTCFDREGTPFIFRIIKLTKFPLVLSLNTSTGDVTLKETMFGKIVKLHSIDVITLGKFQRAEKLLDESC